VKKIFHKYIYNGILSKNVVLPFAKNNRFVFLLHDISQNKESHNHPVYTTNFDVFKQMVDWLQKHFKVVSLDDITDENYVTDYPKNLAAIAFDDGFYSVKELAFPYLSERNIPFTVFANQTAIQENWLWCSNLMMALNTNDIEYLRTIYHHYIKDESVSFENFKKDPVTNLGDRKFLTDDYSVFKNDKFTKYKVYLDEADIKELHAKGVTIGNHTKTHKQLSTCSDEAILDEIMSNKKYLQDLLNAEIEHFAIPFGFHTSYNDYAIEVMKKAHKFVYDTEKNRIKNTLRLIPRIGLQNENTAKLFSYVNYPILRNI
jgi:peptidoglycan/xylan/chitin deacetylase (PgdA/CDA1 family)